MRIRVKVPPKRKPGQKANLTRDIIVAKAISVVNTTDELSIASLARALKVAPGAIYAHFPGAIEEILPEMVRAALAGVARPLHPHEAGEDYIRGLFLAMLDRFRGHRNLSGVVGGQLSHNYYLDPLLVERILHAMDLAVLAQERRAEAVDLVMSSLIGFITIYCPSLGKDASAQWIERQSLILNGLSGEYPQTTGLKEELLKQAKVRISPLQPEVADAIARRFADCLVTGLKDL